MTENQKSDCQGYYEVSGYTTKDGKKVDSYTRNCWKHGESSGVQNTQDNIKNTLKLAEEILKQKVVTDEDILKINHQNQMTIHNLLDDIEDIAVQKSNLPEIPTVESVEQSKVIENSSKQLKENVYQAIVMLNLSKQTLDKNWKKLHIKDNNEEMYKYINKKEEIEKLSNMADKLLKETSNINEKTLNNVQKLREETGLIRFKPMLPQKNIEQEQKWIWPCKGKIVGEYKEQRRDHVHNGIDIAVPENTPVKAIADGKVVVVGPSNGYGYWVGINHGFVNGIEVSSEYGHINKWVVSKGQFVKQGQIIAYSGNTGHSEGPHVHLTIRHGNPGKGGGKAVNPWDYIIRTKY